MATVGLDINEERAKLLSYCQSRFQPICQGILSLDLSEQGGNKSNELTQLSHDSPIANTLHKLLDSATVLAEELFVKITNLPKINSEALTDHESIILKDFSWSSRNWQLFWPLQWQNFQLYKMSLWVSFYVLYLLLKIRPILG